MIRFISADLLTRSTSPSKILRSEQDGFIRGNDSTEAPKFNLWGINYELYSPPSPVPY